MRGAGSTSSGSDDRPTDAGATAAVGDAVPAAVAPKPTRMTRGEQQLGAAVAAVLIAACALSWASNAFNGNSKALGELATGADLSIVLAGAAWYGQRIIASIAAILAGLAPVAKQFVYLPFVALAFGGYLMFKTNRAQMKAAATRPRRTPAERRSSRAKAQKGSRDGGAATTGATGARRPSANRRYTPPKGKPAGRGS